MPLFLVLLLASLSPGPRSSQAQPAPAPATSATDAVRPESAPAAVTPSALTPEQLRQVLQVLQDPARRAEFIATLEAMAKALPAARAPPPARPGAAPAQKAPKLELAPNSLGAQLLRESSSRLSQLPAQLLAAARSVGEFPMLWRWTRDLAADPDAQRQLARFGWRLLVVLGIGLAAEWLVGRALRRPRRIVCERGPEPGWPPGADAAPDDAGLVVRDNADVAEAVAEAAESEGQRSRPSALAMLRRLPFVFVALALDLIPLGAFLAAAFAALAAVPSDPNARLAVLAALDAYVTWRLVLCLVRMVLAPQMPRLRLVHFADVAAAQVFRWIGLFVGVAVAGHAIAEIALLNGLYPIAGQAVFKLFMLASHLLLAAFVLRHRRPVAERVRDHSGRSGAVARARNLLARTWHYIAAFYIVALWLVWAFEVPDGYSRLLRVFVVTAAILLAGRLAAIVLLGALDRAMRVGPNLAAGFPELAARAHRYHAILHRLLAWLIGAAGALALLQSWGLEVGSWFTGRALGGRALWALAVVAVTIVAAVVAWEAADLTAQRHLRRLIEAGEGARAARLRTLLPIMRAVLLATVGLLAALTALAELGVNIGPLLAGAGILGVAVGFGSQKLVQDFITGIFLLAENAMQVGDWVTVGGLSGTVENLSIRTIRLRGGDGSVYIIPFSAVTTVNNSNRGLGNAAVSVNVDYREDTDRVGQVLTEIAAEMRQEPEFQRRMLGELELWGVDKVEASTVTIAGQIVCTDGGRWPVQREFNRRMKRRFQELGIAIAKPTQTVVIQRAHPARAAGATGREPGDLPPAPLLPAAGGSRR